MVRRKQTDVELLAEIASAFAGSLDLENTFGAILRLLDEHVGLQQGMITLLDPDSELIHVNVAHGVSAADAKSITYRVGEGITGTVVQSGRRLSAPTFTRTPGFSIRWAPASGPAAQAWPSSACRSSWRIARSAP